MFLIAAAFLTTILFEGSLNAQTVLKEKPDIIAWAGGRRALSEGMVFWQREYYLESRNHSLSYSNILPNA
jgi:hypothetical protein